MPMQPTSGDPLGWAIIVIGMIATLWAICASIYWIVRPGETEPDHPKRMILKEDR